MHTGTLRSLQALSTACGLLCGVPGGCVATNDDDAPFGDDDDATASDDDSAPGDDDSAPDDDDSGDDDSGDDDSGDDDSGDGDDDDDSALSQGAHVWPGPWFALSAGDESNCALSAIPGVPVCWGQPDSGPLTTLTVELASLANDATPCGLDVSGEPVCEGDWESLLTWGWESDYPSGPLSRFAVGLGYLCGIRPTGLIECWGADPWETGILDEPTGTWSELSCSGWHCCAMTPSGDVSCWGDNEESDLPGSPGTFAFIDVEGSKACAVTTTGELICWGDTKLGSLVPPGADFAIVSVGRAHACALRTDGTMACWGSGIEEYSECDTGQQFAQPGAWLAVSAGEYHNCAIRDDFDIVCWGSDIHGAVSGYIHECNPP